MQQRFYTLNTYYVKFDRKNISKTSRKNVYIPRNLRCKFFAYRIKFSWIISTGTRTTGSKHATVEHTHVLCSMLCALCRYADMQKFRNSEIRKVESIYVKCINFPKSNILVLVYGKSGLLMVRSCCADYKTTSP